MRYVNEPFGGGSAGENPRKRGHHEKYIYRCGSSGRTGPYWALLGLTGLSAHAGCADLRTAAKQGLIHAMPAALALSRMAEDTSNADANFEIIVGTRQVTYTTEGQPFTDAFFQWRGDGERFLCHRGPASAPGVLNLQDHVSQRNRECEADPDDRLACR